MSCLETAKKGRCCFCNDKVTDKKPANSDAITEVKTSTGTHYLCDDCKEKQKMRHERGELDVFEVKG